MMSLELPPYGDKKEAAMGRTPHHGLFLVHAVWNSGPAGELLPRRDLFRCGRIGVVEELADAVDLAGLADGRGGPL